MPPRHYFSIILHFHWHPLRHCTAYLLITPDDGQPMMPRQMLYYCRHIITPLMRYCRHYLLPHYIIIVHIIIILPAAITPASHCWHYYCIVIGYETLLMTFRDREPEAAIVLMYWYAAMMLSLERHASWYFHAMIILRHYFFDADWLRWHSIAGHWWLRHSPLMLMPPDTPRRLMPLQPFHYDDTMPRITPLFTPCRQDAISSFRHWLFRHWFSFLLSLFSPIHYSPPISFHCAAAAADAATILFSAAAATCHARQRLLIDWLADTFRHADW